jgi:hypothetical protein
VVIRMVRPCVWSERQHVISMQSARPQHALSTQSARNQHAISTPSARNQHALSMQSSYLHVAPTAELLARVPPRHRAEEPCAACGVVIGPNPSQIERRPSSLLSRTLRLPLRGRMHAELSHLRGRMHACIRRMHAKLTCMHASTVRRMHASTVRCMHASGCRAHAPPGSTRRGLPQRRRSERPHCPPWPAHAPRAGSSPTKSHSSCSTRQQR